MRPVVHHNPESEKFLRALQEKPRVQILDQLRSLQAGERPLRAKNWHGSGWAGFEIVVGGFRVVGYTRLEAVVVLHAFKKDAAKGRKTRHKEVDLIERRHRESVARYKS